VEAFLPWLAEGMAVHWLRVACHDTTLYPTDADLLHALVPLVPMVTIQATLDELGLGSVPHIAYWKTP